MPQIKYIYDSSCKYIDDFYGCKDICGFKNLDKKLLLIRRLDEIKCILKFDVLNIENISNQKLLENIKKEGITIYTNKE